jgi:hypothetical protein
MRARWSISGGGTRHARYLADNEETMKEDETTIRVDVTVFGNQFMESCYSGG